MQALLLSVSLAVSSAFALHDHHHTSRKSLSFGPILPHAQFVVNPPSPSSLAATTATNPRDVALAFVNGLSAQFAQDGHSYWLREDSYTDAASGVSHFYFRQLVRDFEVADGNINVNVYNGKVISYGDSVCT